MQAEVAGKDLGLGTDVGTHAEHRQTVERVFPVQGNEWTAKGWAWGVGVGLDLDRSHKKAAQAPLQVKAHWVNYPSCYAPPLP